MGNLREGAYYVHNGVLFLLEEIQITKKEHYREDGTRVREDGRTRCIFENGTVSNMLKRSVEKILYANGQVVSENIEKVNEKFIEKFSNITDEDEEAGFIYPSEIDEQFNGTISVWENEKLIGFVLYNDEDWIFIKGVSYYSYHDDLVSLIKHYPKDLGFKS